MPGVELTAMQIVTALIELFGGVGILLYGMKLMTSKIFNMLKKIL